MATVQDVIELLQDPENLKYLSDGDSTHGLAVRTDKMMQHLRLSGVSSKQEAVSLIRQAVRALGGDEAIVQRAGALRVDEFRIGADRAVPAFWIPLPREK